MKKKQTVANPKTDKNNITFNIPKPIKQYIGKHIISYILKIYIPIFQQLKLGNSRSLIRE